MTLHWTPKEQSKEARQQQSLRKGIKKTEMKPGRMLYLEVSNQGRRTAGGSREKPRLAQSLCAQALERKKVTEIASEEVRKRKGPKLLSHVSPKCSPLSFPRASRGSHIPCLPHSSSDSQ